MIGTGVVPVLFSWAMCRDDKAEDEYTIGWDVASDGKMTLGPPYGKSMELGWQAFALSLIAGEGTDEEKGMNLRFLHDTANFNFVTTAQGSRQHPKKEGLCPAGFPTGGVFAWVEAEVGMPPRTAQAYKRVAQWASGKSATIAYFPPAVLYLLSALSTPPEFVSKISARAEAGEKVVLDIRKELRNFRHAASGRRQEEQAPSTTVANQQDIGVSLEEADTPGTLSSRLSARLESFRNDFLKHRLGRTPPQTAASRPRSTTRW